MSHICHCADPECRITGCKALKRTEGVRLPVAPMEYGWICSKCGASCSPSIPTCPNCSNGIKIDWDRLVRSYQRTFDILREHAEQEKQNRTTEGEGQ